MQHVLKRLLEGIELTRSKAKMEIQTTSRRESMGIEQRTTPLGYVASPWPWWLSLAMSID